MKPAHPPALDPLVRAAGRPEAFGPRLSWPRWALLGIVFGAACDLELLQLPPFRFSLAAGLPFAVAWLSTRWGPRVVAPLVALSLLPTLSWSLQMPGFALAFVPAPLALLLLGLGTTAIVEHHRSPSLWSSLWNPDRTWLLISSVILLWLSRFEWLEWRFGELGSPQYLNLASGLAACMLVALIDWRNVMVHAAGQRPGQGTWLVRLGQWALPLGVVAAATVQARLRWHGSGYVQTTLAWGAIPLSNLLSVIVLLSVWSGTVTARRWALIFGLLAAIEAARLALGWPALASLAYPVPWNPGWAALGRAVCEVGAALALAIVTRPFMSEAPRVMLQRRLPALLAALLAVFVLYGLLRDWGSGFLALGRIGWIAGAGGFAMAFAQGARGLLIGPLLIGLGPVFSALLKDGQVLSMPPLADAMGATATAALGGFAGWLANRQAAASVSGDRSAAVRRSIDVGALADIVRRLDVSTTLKAFADPVVMLGVAWAVLDIGQQGMALRRDAAGDASVAELALVTAVLVAIAAAPLRALVLDALQRKESWRGVHALSGAALSAMGSAAVMVALAGPVGLMQDSVESDSALRLYPAIALWLSGVALAGMLLARSRRAVFGCGILLLACVCATVAVMVWLARQAEGDPEAVVSILLMPPVLGLAFVLLARSVRLRADLVSPVPRGLLFGQVPGGGFWASLGWLLGLPASMLRRSALRTTAFWAFLVARPLVYAGALGAFSGEFLLAAIAAIGGHVAFDVGKRLAARQPWQREATTSEAPILFLRSFDDDQLDFGRAVGGRLQRWLALWSFRRNLDEALVDEVGRYGPVVALGRPGQSRAPYGAARHYAAHDDWQRCVLETARSARAIVVVAGDTPGVHWELALLGRERLLERTVLLFKPGIEAQATNRAALAVLPLSEAERACVDDGESRPWIALLFKEGTPLLLCVESPTPQAYVVALRAHFQDGDASTLAQAAKAAQPAWPLSLTGSASELSSAPSPGDLVAGARHFRC